ncbi:MAG: phosphotransferase [Lachnospiraceae bacterium]|nr:phosphotransferase [Lachnospiraceae bacterium]
MKLDTVIAERKNKTVYRDKNLAIKVFTNEYSKADILNEACNQARVEDCGLNIPRVREVCKIDGKWAIATEYVEGITLQKLMDDHPEKMDEYLDLFVDLQMQIHAKKVPHLNKLKEKMQRKISETTLDATTRYELHTRLASLPEHDKVCHGDFVPSNVIITPDNKAYIIDWAHVTSGNASADVARTYLTFCLKNKKDIAEKYLNLFCKKSDTAKQYVQKWLPIVAASQSVKGNEEEREFLLSWTNVVDYE